MSIYFSGERRFIVTNKLAILSLFLVILAGGVVRSTGSGMGCPDWPKCFNQYIPPTNESQLPEGYEQSYIDSRAKKNERFASMLDLLGYGNLAVELRNDESILVHEEFNAAKTWTEYVNRLLGAIAGVFLLLCVVFSWVYVKVKTRIFFFSVLNLFVVFFQAWLGSIVVSTNLMPWIITLHMLLALLIVAISIYTYFQARVLRDNKLLLNVHGDLVKLIASIAIMITIVQVILGTDVREQIDALAIALGDDRPGWIEALGLTFHWHRYLAIAVIIVNAILFVLIKSRYARQSEQSTFVGIVAVLVLVQLASGFALSFFGIPPYMQTVHLVIASLLFGSQYYLVLLSGKTSHYIGQ